MSLADRIARRFMLLAICAAALHTGSASAADAGGASAAASPGSDLQEIIVSARKRDESLARLPISISVFTAATIQEQNIQSFDDYATKVPNLSFTYGQGPTGISEARTVAHPRHHRTNLIGTSGRNGLLCRRHADSRFR